MSYRYKKIVLIGYMGVGKSIVGQKLAEHIGYSFVDLDEYISTNEKKTIQQLFDEKGEIYFRKRESYYLSQLLEHSEIVLSTGGGTPCYANNLQLIQSVDTFSIYLKATLPTIMNRLKSDNNQRPLLKSFYNENDLESFIGPHLFERSYYYHQADLIFDTDDKLIDQVVKELLELLN